MYQTEFRKPSFTVFCLDFSGSMNGSGETELKKAMDILLDQEKAKNYMLQSSKEDIIIVITFSSGIGKIWKASGSNVASIESLNRLIQKESANGSTDIYTPVAHALEIISNYEQKNQYIPAVILMTDGESNVGRDFNYLKQKYVSTQIDVPVFSIMFGNADENQLNEIAELTRSRVFNGKHNLIAAFRKAKGYN